MKNYKFLFTIFFPLHLLLIALPFFTDFAWINILYFLAGYVFIGGLGVGIGLHRWAAHKSFEENKIAKPFLLLASLMSCQGHPIWWSAVHRGYHHRFSDTEKDHHSPIHYGKWHAFLGWIVEHDPSTINYKFSIDLLRDQWMVKTAKYYELIVWSIWIILGLISPEFLLWFAIIPAVVSFHGEGLINAFCHGDAGYTNYDNGDRSRNVPILGYLFWGNGWHNNHHHKASSFDFGKSVSGNNKEFDPCTLLLPLLKK